MKHFGLREQFLAFIHICRAIFHANVANGTRVPFFSNFIMNAKC
ncbi:RAxF-45 family protein [Bacillus spongiae]|uniref:RAxF-45 family protein n=1 Tax=Bacillus spongiae TaxID=2683610 RepID=A0ABU8HGX8_9BACI